VHAAGTVLVLEHVAGRVWSRADARSPRGLRFVGPRLRGLHALPLAPGLRTVAVDAAIARYLAVPPPDGGPLPRERLAAHAARVLADHVPRGAAFCHHDLHHLNVVEPAAGPPVFLDWEYAGAGDPWLDLAAYCAYHDLDADARRVLLDAYGDADGDSRHRLDGAIAAFDCLQALWYDAADGWRALPPDRRDALLARLGGAPR
jgi:aminoglycoside phosphotransferase (APT) family kinase protein